VFVLGKDLTAGPDLGEIVTIELVDTDTGDRTVLASRTVDETQELGDSLVQRMRDNGTHETVAGVLDEGLLPPIFVPTRAYKNGDQVEAFEEGQSCGSGRIVATPDDDATLVEGEYRVHLTGVTQFGINEDVFEEGELRPFKAVKSVNA
jgi:hypothetical protein